MYTLALWCSICVACCCVYTVAAILNTNSDGISTYESASHAVVSCDSILTCSSRTLHSYPHSYDHMYVHTHMYTVIAL
jgi:hypothetical protein